MTNPENQLIFRGIKNEDDYPLLFDIFRSSTQADHQTAAETLEDLIRVYSPSASFDPQRNVILAALADNPALPLGYSRLGTYTSRTDTRLFYQVSHLKQEYRGSSVWDKMVFKNEERMREFAKETQEEKKFFQAWAADYQTQWMSVLKRCGYAVVRRFNNMLYSLDNIPVVSPPSGIKFLPGKLEFMPLIWQAQKEMNALLFENVAEDWLDEKYPAWLEKADNKAHYWITAWDGNQLVGTLCAHFDPQDNPGESQKRGYTEHIYVRPQWRKRGLASVLIAQGLLSLKIQGAEVAELGVDAENESAAFRLYEKLGYRTDNVDTWLRKPMD